MDLGILNRLRALSEDDGDGWFRRLISGFLGQSADKVDFGALAMTPNCDTLQSAAESGDAAEVCKTPAHLKKALSDTRIALSLLDALGGNGNMAEKCAIGPRQSVS